MVAALKYASVFILLLLLSGCFGGSKRSVHTLPQKAHSNASVVKNTPDRSYSEKSYHTVKAGETLYEIGRKFGVDYKALARRNHLRPPYTIYIGQKIYLSGSPPVTQAKSKSAPRAVAKHPVEKKKVEKKRTTVKKPASAHVRFPWPVDGEVTSRFGRRGSRMHDGIDIGAKDGSPVYAVAAGVVVHSNARLSGYGKLIIIRHSDTLFTAYAHNQNLLVEMGDRVRAGQMIARVGHSGHASGPHLHFEVRIGTRPVDPLHYLIKK